MEDYLVKATTYNGMVRAYGVISTDAVKEVCRRQDTWATASAALGRTITITAMMGAMLKGEDSITVKVQGDGPVGGIIADGNAKAEVRGYISNPHVDFDLNAFGKLDVARAVGTQGTVSVVKDLGLKDYFTGEVPIISGEIGEDFTYYFAHSEQTPSAVGAGVLVNPDHSVLASGGFIIQVMPGATEEIIEQLEARVQAFPTLSTLIQEGNTPEGLLEHLFPEEEVKILERLPVKFRCRCSRERFEQAMIGLGNKEIEAMIEEDHGAEVSCHFCNEVYHFTEEELQTLIKQ
ncbi:Hsp33 family molecular chaperone HslO [Virgibacillus sp. NKC19-16]|uniref:Hsp33 family molecular chaperone HslO n=1 Tax=Virgibacillus salidurans TaxID=2831673 RepID=UPI001F1FE24D|nr:Hsp33 family molecular chaperone HslO [Virgibacillus sp. NKC19-16]UJL46508.1 Hsp33 family molecular chaperone HslO [Virgibacillus sp. NKC19-16]